MKTDRLISSAGLINYINKRDCKKHGKEQADKIWGRMR